MSAYAQFLERKRVSSAPSGFECEEIHPVLFPFQRDIVTWAVKRGKAAIFAGTGLGKTLMQLEFSRQVADYTGDPILILAPLAVSTQTAREAIKLDVSVHVCRSQDDIQAGINITNYERLHLFDSTKFAGVVLDESSILKSFDSATRNLIIDRFRDTPYKLACTATPAPNDYMELGNHAEFLNIMSRTEMLATFFVHDSGDTSKWRLKGHAQDKFWEWVASWGVLIRKPSDLGYDDSAFDLPPLTFEDHVVEASELPDDRLFAIEAQTLQERQSARRNSIADRVKVAADIVNASDKPFLVWCDLNVESGALTRAIPDAVEVKGADSPEHKEQAMMDFADGKIRCLVTKPSLAGFGMNWQHCADMAFVGLSDSFEQMFQAVRRCWRFGQQNPVTVHIVTSELEGAVTANIRRKEADFEAMMDAMSEHTRKITQANVRSAANEKEDYAPQKALVIPEWLRGDGVW